MQPERFVSGQLRLGRARGPVQRGGGQVVVRGELGRLLVAQLRLARHPAPVAQRREHGRHVVRRGPVARPVRTPDGGAQLVGELVEPGTPLGALDVAGREQRRALLLRPLQVPGVGLDQLPGVVEQLGAVLAHGLQRAVAGAVRGGGEHQEALVGERGEVRAHLTA